MIGVSGIVLAAGSSSRLGQPKQLLDLEGRPLLQHAIDAAEGAGLFDVLIVLGHRADDVAAAVTVSERTRVVVNPDYAEGQATSLRAGLQAADPRSRAAIILLGDQPAVDAVSLRALADAYERTESPVVQAAYSGRPGHPVLFDRSLWADLEAIEGDTGARDLLKSNPEWIVRVELGGEVPRDLDTWQDYERLKDGFKEP